MHLPVGSGSTLAANRQSRIDIRSNPSLARQLPLDCAADTTSTLSKTSGKSICSREARLHSPCATTRGLIRSPASTSKDSIGRGALPRRYRPLFRYCIPQPASRRLCSTPARGAVLAQVVRVEKYARGSTSKRCACTGTFGSWARPNCAAAESGAKSRLVRTWPRYRLTPRFPRALDSKQHRYSKAGARRRN